eukprot:5411846-Amphidinium_carterae.2
MGHQCVDITNFAQAAISHETLKEANAAALALSSSNNCVYQKHQVHRKLTNNTQQVHGIPLIKYVTVFVSLGQSVMSLVATGQNDPM